jgi:diguanylate cyclase (GGDEF)-like protein
LYACLCTAFAALFLLHSSLAVAQRFTFQSFAQRDGLRNLNFHCLLQQSDGSLLVCTEFGLYRYDGSRFELVPTVEGSSLPLIQGIAQDLAGRIWISTPQVLLYRDGSGVHSVASPGQDLRIDLQTPIVVTPGDPSQVYFISQHRLMEARTRDNGVSWQIVEAYDGPTLARYPMLAKIKGAYADREGRLWVGCDDELCETGHGKVTLWGRAEGVPADDWSAVLEDRRGNLWARGNHHIVRLPKQAVEFVSEDKEMPAPALELRSPCLIEDPQGRILTNTADGLARWSQGSWTLFTRQNGLPGGLVQTMIFDRQGSLWFDGGKAQLQRWIGYDQWENWTTEDGLASNLVWSILRSTDDKLWIGTELDLERMEPTPHGWELRRAGGNLHVRRLQSIGETADKHLWIGSDDGSVVEYDPARGSSRLITAQRNVYQVLVDRDDRVWVLTASGLFWVDRSGGRRELRSPPTDAVPSMRFFRAVQDASGDLIFTSDGGIFRLAKLRWSHIRMPASFKPGYNTQIARGKEGTFWISGTSPLVMQIRIDGDTATQISEASVPTVASANVILMASDQRGWLWVGTDSGMDVFNGTEWRHAGEEDGLIWNDTDTGAFFADADGSVWIGTSGGLSHLPHPERLFAKEPLELELSQAKLGSLELERGERRSATWGHYSLVFHVASPDFARGHAIRYRYQLSGVDDAPQETQDHEIRYSFVPDGRHRLVVTAVDAASHRVSEPQVLEFEISPPWWRAPWFFALTGLGTALLIVGAWRWSNRLAIARRHALECQVKERTRELEEKNASLLDARAALMEQATRDSLTGILNRGAIYSVLQHEIERARREEHPLVAVMADVDHFKRINDVYGHQCGDSVLREVTQRLRSAIRTYDSLGRYGGEEFLILIPGLGDAESGDLIERIRKIIEEDPFLCGEASPRVTCSFGVAWLGAGDDLEALIHAADQALYQAKANGRNRVEFAVTDAGMRV